MSDEPSSPRQSDLDEFRELPQGTPSASGLSPTSSRANSPSPSMEIHDIVPTPISGSSKDYATTVAAIREGMSTGLNLQRPLFVLDGPTISSEQAAKFQQQANQWSNNFTVQQVVVDPTTFLLAYTFASDPEFTQLNLDQVDKWYDYLLVKETAHYITKYFGDKNDSGRTLAENFAKIPLRFNYSNPEVERETYMAMLLLTKTYERDHVIKPSEHAALIITIEKKLPSDSHLKVDYMTKRGAKPIENETWKAAFTRLTVCINNVRSLIKQIAHYGETSKTYVYAQRLSDDQFGKSSTPPMVQRQIEAQVAKETPPPPAPLPLPVKRTASELVVNLLP